VNESEANVLLKHARWVDASQIIDPVQAMTPVGWSFDKVARNLKKSLLLFWASAEARFNYCGNTFAWAKRRSSSNFSWLTVRRCHYYLITWTIQ